METNQAIMAFSQSEKLKSALIWASQLGEMNLALAEADKPGAEKIIKTQVSMIANEIGVAQRINLALYIKQCSHLISGVEFYLSFFECLKCAKMPKVPKIKEFCLL